MNCKLPEWMGSLSCTVNGRGKKSSQRDTARKSPQIAPLTTHSADCYLFPFHFHIKTGVSDDDDPLEFKPAHLLSDFPSTIFVHLRTCLPQILFLRLKQQHIDPVVKPHEIPTAIKVYRTI